MASIEEVYEQVVANDEEKAAFVQAAASEEGLAAFLAARGCDASAQDVAEFLRGKQGELADAELGAVAGGCNETTGWEACMSTLSLGITCAAVAITSVFVDRTPNMLEGGRLCNHDD